MLRGARGEVKLVLTSSLGRMTAKPETSQGFWKHLGGSVTPRASTIPRGAVTYVYLLT